MLQFGVDHLWQTLQFSAAAWLLAWWARGNAAIVRLWLWRLAALKFAVPFHLLFAFGKWRGFPVAHTADRAPQALIDAVYAVTPYVAPAAALAKPARILWLALVGLALTSAFALRFILRQMRREQMAARDEAARIEIDGDARRPALGFVKGALFTAVGIALYFGVSLGGQIRGHLERHDLLLANARALRHAVVEMKPAAPGLGERFRLIASADGIELRNVTLQELTSLAYGVARFSVRGDHFQMEEGGRDWLTATRYDLRIAGHILEPERFDPYALRQPVTRMLAEEHGLEIYLNGECKPPCGTYRVPMPDEPL